MGRHLLIAALALVGSAAPAQAAEVSASTETGYDSTGSYQHTVARFTAAPGEVNDLSIRYEDRLVVFRDRVPLTAGAGCGAGADGAVACTADWVEVDLGDGDDAGRGVPYRGPPLLMAGGAGDDRLTGGNLDGGDGADTLTGTPEADSLTGGAGPDTVSGLGGSDMVTGDGPGAAPAPDILDAGRGRDLLSYEGHATPVRVELAHQRGDEDALASFEDVHGGDGDDVLIGGLGSNRLFGGTGRNVLSGLGGRDVLWTVGPAVMYGGGGPDELEGGGEADAMFGGPGDDSLDGLSGLDRYAGGPGDDKLLLSGDPVGEPVDCGGGHDRTDWPGPALLLPNCELVEGLRVYPRRAPAGRLTFTVGGRDRGRLELRVAGRARRFAVGRADGGRVRIRPPRRILRLRRAPLLVEARFYVGGRRRTTWVFDLRRAQDLPR
jgi:Ca2+-binding RTX toxin-like protein